MLRMRAVLHTITMRAYGEISSESKGNGVVGRDEGADLKVPDGEFALQNLGSELQSFTKLRSGIVSEMLQLVVMALGEKNMRPERENDVEKGTLRRWEGNLFNNLGHGMLQRRSVQEG